MSDAEVDAHEEKASAVSKALRLALTDAAEHPHSTQWAGGPPCQIDAR